MSTVIKFVKLGNQIGAVKMGKCPMYAVANLEEKSEFIKSIREDFPNCRFEKGFQQDRENLARFLIKSKSR